MRNTILKVSLCAAACVISAGVLQTSLSGYARIGHKWAGSQVMYYVNPQSLTVSAADALAAIQAGASAWSDQTRANVRLMYGGSTNGSSLALNFKNEVFFRNE